MPTHTMTAPVDAADPLQNAGHVVDSAMLAVRQGATGAQERISGAMPAIGHFVSRLVYTSCYGLSFGVVFPVMLVVRIVPKDNAMVHGLVDGAIAAREQVDGWGNGAIEEKYHDHDLEGAEFQDVEAEADSPPVATTHHRKRATTRRGGNHKPATKSARKR
jgi:hypothetical protein